MSEQASFSRLASRGFVLSTVVLWTAAAAVMLAVHATGIWYAREWQPIGPPPAGNPQPAIEFDLAPPTTLPEAPPQEAMAEIQPEQAQETTTETVQPVEPEPVQPQTQEIEPTPVEPQHVPEQAPPEPEPTPPEPVPEVVPDLPAKDKAEVILPAAPKPQPKPKKEKKPVPRKEPERQRQVAQPKPAMVAPRQQAAQATAPRQQGSATGDELAAWRRAVNVRLSRVASSMSSGRKGAVGVSFSVNSSGQVSRGRVIKSSGDPDLDAKAITVVGRLGSVGAPPGGGTRPVNVSIIFK